MSDDKLPPDLEAEYLAHAEATMGKAPRSIPRIGILSLPSEDDDGSAAEIARLRADNERLARERDEAKAAAEKWGRSFAGGHRERDAARAELDMAAASIREMADECRAVKDERDALAERCERMRAVVEAAERQRERSDGSRYTFSEYEDAICETDRAVDAYRSGTPTGGEG